MKGSYEYVSYSYPAGTKNGESESGDCSSVVEGQGERCAEDSLRMFDDFIDDCGRLEAERNQFELELIDLSHQYDRLVQDYDDLKQENRTLYKVLRLFGRGVQNDEAKAVRCVQGNCL